MDLDFRKLDAHKLFDFSKEEEQLIFEIYDRLFELYNISVVHIEDSLYSKFSSDIQNTFSLLIPKICYFITDKDQKHSFYLFVVSKIQKTWKGAKMPVEYDTLQLWGLKDITEDFGYISVHKKKLIDKVAGIFNRFSINFNDRDFKDFYVLGSDKFKNFFNFKKKRNYTIFS